ncbi:MAG: hypothetical protein AAGI91_13580 [Bacteroidota bacterium]
MRHFAGGAAASFLVLTFLLGFVGCDRNLADANQPGVDVEVDVRPAPCDSTRYEEPPVSERREVDPSGNVRVKVTVRTCCCCCGEPVSRRTGYVPPVPITGTGPGSPPPTRTTPPADLPELPELPPVAELPPIQPGPPLRTTPPTAGGFPGGVPALPPIAPPAQAGIPWWLGLLGAPLLLFTVGDNEGVICGPDSGLPTGPNRPRCN